MKTAWIEVSCTVPETMVDVFGDFLIELSGNGISIENLSLDTFSLDTIETSPVKTVKAYFPADFPLQDIPSAISAFVAEHRNAFPDFAFLPPEITLLREEDWANNWKEHFKPSRIGRHLVIKPTWETYAGGAEDIIIEVDPGQAFGTGTHATTRLCLEALEKIFMEKAPNGSATLLQPAGVLDVGTGSGVLSIAAAKLGACRITAIDIDPDAVTVARENLALNHIGGDVTVSTIPLRDTAGTYQIVVANIIAEELVKLGPELFSRVQPSGHLILSGILTEKEEYVMEGFAGFRLDLVETTRREEWSCLMFRREP